MPRFTSRLQEGHLAVSWCTLTTVLYHVYGRKIQYTAKTMAKPIAAATTRAMIGKNMSLSRLATALRGASIGIGLFWE